MIVLKLPYPPSANTYYRSLRKGKLAGRVLISEKGRAYCEAVAAIVGNVNPLGEHLIVMVTLYPPDRRKRDIDNPIKPLLDSLTKSGLWLDDSQIKRIEITMTDIIGGYASVVVMEKEHGH